MGHQWRQSASIDASAATASDDSLAQWFAVQVRSRREAITATHLHQRGYEVFLPVYDEQRRWVDRLKTARKALFAGYLFCRGRATALAKVVTTPGVIRIVANAQGPLPVEPCEIDAIRQIVSTRLPASPWPYVREGQAVRIAKGPLAGVEGIVVSHPSGHRLVVALSLLQRSVSVEMDHAWVSGDAPLAPGGEPPRRGPA